MTITKGGSIWMEKGSGIMVCWMCRTLSEHIIMHKMLFNNAYCILRLAGSACALTTDKDCIFPDGWSALHCT